MASPVEWAKAFARQARADFATWQALQSVSVVPPCHELLFLQMACEKLTKAHLFHKGSDSPKILTSHAHTAKQLPTIISPLDWTFQPEHLLTQPAGRTFLKIVKQAINQLA